MGPDLRTGDCRRPDGRTIEAGIDVSVERDSVEFCLILRLQRLIAYAAGCPYSGTGLP